MPAQAEALNDRSSMPPVSVTMHALYAAAVLAPPPLGLDAGGGLPQAAAESVSPPAARIATICFPRTGRKTPSFHCAPHLRGTSSGSVRAGHDAVRRSRRTVGAPLPALHLLRDLGVVVALMAVA